MGLVTRAGDVRARLRDGDDRVPLVERALLAARLGLTGDDLGLLADATVADLLALPTGVTLTIGAARLLERLDAHVARAHTVDLDHRDDATVARVALGADGEHGVVTAALGDGAPDRLVVLAVDDREVASLDVGETEALGRALLRLAALAGDPP